MTSHFYRRFWQIIVILALLVGRTGAQAAIQTWISGIYAPTSGSMQVSFADTIWSTPVIPGQLQTQYFNLDEGVEYLIEVTGTDVSEHTLMIGADQSYAVFIEDTECNAYKISGPSSGSVTTVLKFSIYKRWDINIDYTRRPNGANDHGLGESGSMNLGQPNDGSAFYWPHLRFDMGQAANGMPMPTLPVSLYDYAFQYYAGPDAAVTNNPIANGGGYVVDTAQVRVIRTAYTYSGPTGTAAGLWTRTCEVHFCPAGSSAPFVKYEVKLSGYYSTTAPSYRTTAMVTKTYPASGRQYTMKVVFDPFDPTAGAQLGGYTMEDWTEVKMPSVSPLRRVRLQRTYTSGTSARVSDVITVATAADFSSPVAVTTNVYLPDTQVGTEPSQYLNYIYRLESSTESSDDRNYVTTVIDPLNPLINGYHASNGKTVIAETIDYNLPTITYRTWLDKAPTKAVGQPVAANGCLIERILYTNDWSGAMVLPTSIRRRAGPSSTLLTETTIIHGQESGNPNGRIVETEQRYDFVRPSSGAVNDDIPRSATDGPSLKTTTKFYRADVDDMILAKMPYALERPNGTKTSYAYEIGDWDVATEAFSPSNVGSSLRITSFRGVMATTAFPANLTAHAGITIDPIRVVENKSTKTVEILFQGRLVRTDTYVCNGSGSFDSVAINWAKFSYDDAGHLLERSSSDNSHYVATWDGARKSTEADETTQTAHYYYDEMDRLSKVTRDKAGPLVEGRTPVPEQVTIFEYDAAHRLRFIRSGAGGEQIITERQYDTGGRITTVVDQGIITSYSHIANSIGGWQIKKSWSSGTQTVDYYPGGELKSVTGTAAVAEYHQYDFGGTSAQFYHTTRLGDDSFTSSTGRTKTTFYDLLGRTVKQTSNGFGSTGSTNQLVTHYEYNSSGQRSKIYTEQDGSPAIQTSADQVFTYDEFGQLTGAGLDLDGTGGLQKSSGAAVNDRFTAYDHQFVKEGGTWYWQTRQDRFNTHQSENSDYVISKTRLGALPSVTLAETSTQDTFGNIRSQNVLISTSDVARVSTSRGADGTTAVRTIAGGMLTNEVVYNSAHQTPSGPPDLSMTYTYDNLGRMIKATELRAGAATASVTTSYWPNTTLAYQTTDGNNHIVTTRSYDTSGRLISSAGAAHDDGTTSVARFDYNARGQVIREWGNAGHPVEYEYNAYGERTKVRTFRNTTLDFNQATWPISNYPSSQGDATTFDFDPNTGLLTTQTDADNKEIVYSYTINSSYREVVRKTARKVPGTTNSYTATSQYSLATGDLLHVSYSDALTTNLTYTYTRSGDVRTVTDATGTRIFYYNGGIPSAEYLDQTFFHDFVWARRAQSSQSGTSIVGRFAGFEIFKDSDRDPANNTGLLKELGVDYGYDTLGRVVSLTAGYRAQGSTQVLSLPASYSYLDTSNVDTHSTLWRSYTQGNFSVQREFESNRDVLISLTALHSAGDGASFGRGTDNAGRSHWSTQSGTLFGDVQPGTYYRYTYNPAVTGELTSATGYRGTNWGDTTNALPGREFSYGYDRAGNRVSAAVSGDTVGYRSGEGTSDTAGGNALNQTRSRGTLKTRASGSAAVAASVKVGGNAVSRSAGSDTYWDYAIPSYSQNVEIDVVGSRTGYTSKTARIWSVTRPANEVLRYDADGNLIEDGMWNYQWDLENRLVSMSTSAAKLAWGAPLKTISFTYDYLGRRVRKVSSETTPWGTITRDRKYLYDGWNLVAEINTATGQIMRSYVWGLNSSGELDDSSPAGALVLEAVHTTAAVTAFHVVSDAAGNVAGLLRESTGAVAAAYEYGPFGEPVRAETFDTALNDPADTSGKTAHQPFRHGTKYTDSETGLVYYGYRYYDPSQGRFISRDPIGSAGGANVYAFGGNGPVNGEDILGMSWWSDFLNWLGGSPAATTRGRSEGSSNSDDDNQWAGSPDYFFYFDSNGDFVADVRPDRKGGLTMDENGAVVPNSGTSWWNRFEDWSYNNLGDENGRTPVQQIADGEAAMKRAADVMAAYGSGPYLLVGFANELTGGNRLMSGLYGVELDERFLTPGERRLAVSLGLLQMAGTVTTIAGAREIGGQPAPVPHKNSLEYVGETHVYRVKGPDGTTYKIGESAQGVRMSDGASIRAEQQARRLTRETGDVYTTEIRKTFPDKASAREYETNLIERFRRLYGEDTLPGNKTNR